MIIFLASILICLSLLFETLGFNFRRIGKIKGYPSLGYSIHVQFATISRLGIFIGFPLIGFLVDTSSELNSLIIVPLLSYLALFMILIFFLIFIKKLDNLFYTLFNFMLKISRVKISGQVHDVAEIKDNILPINKIRILAVGSFSFLFQSIGIFIVSICAFLFPEYKATILLMSPSITAIGTLISVIFFDPYISEEIDNKAEPIEVISYVYLARAISSFVAAMIFSILFLWQSL